MSAASPPPRSPEPNELLPEDYFRRLTREEIFPDSAPLEVDLGSGDGSFLLDMAAHYPERCFLGVERLLGRVRKLCRRSERAGGSRRGPPEPHRTPRLRPRLSRVAPGPALETDVRFRRFRSTVPRC